MELPSEATGYSSSLLENIDDIGLLQCLLWGEARGETIDGKIGVAWVVKNRVDHPTWWGHDWQSVILKPKQFSCFNRTDPNLQKILGGYRLRFIDKQWKLCRWIAGGVIYGWINDNVNGSNHYCVASIYPSWAKNQQPVKVIGNHKFYLL